MPAALKAQAKDVFQRMSSVETVKKVIPSVIGRAPLPRNNASQRDWWVEGNTQHLEGPQMKGCSSSASFTDTS